MAPRRTSRPALIVLATALLAGPSTALAKRRPPPKAACIAADAVFNVAHADASGLTACTTENQCWHADLAAGVWTLAPALPDAPLRTPGELDVDASGIKLCAPGGKPCDAIVLPGVDTKAPDDHVTAVTNADASLVAVAVNGTAVRVFDAVTKKELYVVKPLLVRKDDIPIVQGFEFLGDVLYVKSSASPVSSSGRLYRARTGKLVMDVGKKGSDIDEVEPVSLGKDRWAFGTWQMVDLLVLDLKKGTLVKRIPLGDPKAQGSGLVLLAVGTDGKLVALGADASGSQLQSIDVATGKRTAIKIPRC